MNEFQLAFEASRQEFYALGTIDPEIGEASRAGFWVVTEQYPVHCPRTDGVMGCFTRLDAIASCQAEAEAFLQYRYESDPHDSFYSILGPEGT